MSAGEGNESLDVVYPWDATADNPSTWTPMRPQPESASSPPASQSSISSNNSIAVLKLLVIIWCPAANLESAIAFAHSICPRIDSGGDASPSMPTSQTDFVAHTGFRGDLSVDMGQHAEVECTILTIPPDAACTDPDVCAAAVQAAARASQHAVQVAWLCFSALPASGVYPQQLHGSHAARNQIDDVEECKEEVYQPLLDFVHSIATPLSSALRRDTIATEVIMSLCIRVSDLRGHLTVESANKMDVWWAPRDTSYHQRSLQTMLAQLESRPLIGSVTQRDIVITSTHDNIRPFALLIRTALMEPNIRVRRRSIPVTSQTFSRISRPSPLRRIGQTGVAKINSVTEQPHLEDDLSSWSLDRQNRSNSKHGSAQQRESPTRTAPIRFYPAISKHSSTQQRESPTRTAPIRFYPAISSPPSSSSSAPSKSVVDADQTGLDQPGVLLAAQSIPALPSATTAGGVSDHTVQLTPSDVHQVLTQIASLASTMEMVIGRLDAMDQRMRSLEHQTARRRQTIVDTEPEDQVEDEQSQDY